MQESCHGYLLLEFPEVYQLIKLMHQKGPDTVIQALNGCLGIRSERYPALFYRQPFFFGLSSNPNTQVASMLIIFSATFN